MKFKGHFEGLHRPAEAFPRTEPAARRRFLVLGRSRKFAARLPVSSNLASRLFARVHTAIANAEIRGPRTRSKCSRDHTRRIPGVYRRAYVLSPGRNSKQDDATSRCNLILRRSRRCPAYNNLSLSRLADGRPCRVGLVNSSAVDKVIRTSELGSFSDARTRLGMQPPRHRRRVILVRRFAGVLRRAGGRVAGRIITRTPSAMKSTECRAEARTFDANIRIARASMLEPTANERRDGK